MLRTLALALVLLAPGAARGQGASARLTYDAANLGLNGGDGFKTSDNAAGTLAWGESYVMMSYAAMFRGTGDPTYLERLADQAASVLAQRDSSIGLKDYNGASRPCWQATKYSTNNLPYCWVVHTGMIAYPMADLALLLEQNPALKSRTLPGGQTLGQAAQQLLAEVEQTVATHDFQYKSGPAAGEGHYVGDPAASAVVPSVAGLALPLNQMNAMGRALIALWKATGKTAYQQKAAALCTYLRNRMTKSGATYVWTYWGTAWSSGKGEDISHAAINADFAKLCHEHGLAFDAGEMVRLGRTLFDNVHVSTDSAADLVDGGGGTNTYKWAVGRWLNLAPYEPRVWPVAANIYRDTTTTSSGSVLLGLANIARHAPPVRDYSFYHVDWSDLGDYRQATAYGANLLALPPAPTDPFAIRMGYRAAVAATVDQWDGSKYHANQRLAASPTTFTWVYAPYDPKLYLAYSGSKILYQLTDSFVAGKGIEVKEVAAAKDPTISTTQAPEATVGAPYALNLQGSGDKPLLWSLTKAPASMTIDLQSGAIAWTPTASDVPAVQVTVRLQNDAGHVEQTLSIAVRSPGTDGAVAGDGGGSPDLPPATHDGATQTGDGATPSGETDGACGCRVASRPGPLPGWPLLLLFGWRFGWRRERYSPPCLRR